MMNSNRKNYRAPIAVYLCIVLYHCTAFEVHRHHPHTARYEGFQTRVSQTYATLSPSALRYSAGSDVESTLGQERVTTLPFHTSIAGPHADLTFVSFWDWHMSFLENTVAGLRAVDCTSRDSVTYGDFSKTGRLYNNFTYSENIDKGARIHNRCFESDNFRKIRMTYYDGGHRCQVFNALWYPRYGSNLPVLGVDLLAFGSPNPKSNKRYLAIVDFQPVEEINESNGDSRPLYERDVMAPIRKKYPSLQGKMTDRFYDEKEFFSQEMLYGRFEDDDTDAVAQLFPAFTEYLNAYTEVVQKERQRQGDDYLNLKLLEEPAKERQTVYDNYNAERDPAKKMFEGLFGKEWSEEFVHGFLFSLSSPQINDYVKGTINADLHGLSSENANIHNRGAKENILHLGRSVEERGSTGVVLL